MIQKYMRLGFPEWKKINLYGSYITIRWPAMKFHLNYGVRGLLDDILPMGFTLRIEQVEYLIFFILTNFMVHIF